MLEMFRSRPREVRPEERGARAFVTRAETGRPLSSRGPEPPVDCWANKGRAEFRPTGPATGGSRWKSLPGSEPGDQASSPSEQAPTRPGSPKLVLAIPPTEIPFLRARDQGRPERCAVMAATFRAGRDAN